MLVGRFVWMVERGGADATGTCGLLVRGLWVRVPRCLPSLTWRATTWSSTSSGSRARPDNSSAGGKSQQRWRRPPGILRATGTSSAAGTEHGRGRAWNTDSASKRPWSSRGHVNLRCWITPSVYDRCNASVVLEIEAGAQMSALAANCLPSCRRECARSAACPSTPTSSISSISRPVRGRRSGHALPGRRDRGRYGAANGTSRAAELGADDQALADGTRGALVVDDQFEHVRACGVHDRGTRGRG
jgi:hypothetical protein